MSAVVKLPESQKDMLSYYSHVECGERWWGRDVLNPKFNPERVVSSLINKGLMEMAPSGFGRHVGPRLTEAGREVVRSQ